MEIAGIMNLKGSNFKKRQARKLQSGEPMGKPIFFNKKYYYTEKGNVLDIMCKFWLFCWSVMVMLH